MKKNFEYSFKGDIKKRKVEGRIQSKMRGITDFKKELKWEIFSKLGTKYSEDLGLYYTESQK